MAAWVCVTGVAGGSAEGGAHTHILVAAPPAAWEIELDRTAVLRYASRFVFQYDAKECPKPQPRAGVRWWQLGFLDASCSAESCVRVDQCKAGAQRATKLPIAQIGWDLGLAGSITKRQTYLRLAVACVAALPACPANSILCIRRAARPPRWGSWC